MAIRLLPTAPQRTDTPDNYVLKADAMMAALPLFVSDSNALAAGLTTIAAGGAFSIPYTYKGAFSTGNGSLSLSSTSPQSASTTLYLDNTSAALQDITSQLAAMAESNSAVKGHIKVVKLADPTKFMLFKITGAGANTGYYALTVAHVSSGGNSNPFTNNDSLIALFQRTGDVGSSGTIVRRSVAGTTFTSLSPDVTNTDLQVALALATACSIIVPTGTPSNGQGLMFRLKDNGVAKALSWNAIYRASPDLALPTTTTVGYTLYVGFIYNSTDSKWDLMSTRLV